MLTDYDDDDEFDALFPPEPTAFDVIHLARINAQAPLRLTPCPCGGPPQISGKAGESAIFREFLTCPQCHGIGFLDVPTTLEALQQTLPGSVERVCVMAARYRDALPVLPDVDRQLLQRT